MVPTLLLLYIIAIYVYRNFTESCNTLKPNHVLVIAQLCRRRGLRKTQGKYVRAGIPWIESKSKLAAQSPIISLPNKLNTRFIHSSLHKQARDNSKVTLVTQFSIFNSIVRSRKISVFKYTYIYVCNIYACIHKTHNCMYVHAHNMHVASHVLTYIY